jgi:hypothetical protein
MTRFRYLGLAVLVVTLAVTVALTTRLSGQGTASYSTGSCPTTSYGGVPNLDKHTYVIYSLDDLGGDDDLGKWVADTVPVVIDPNTWGQCRGGSVSYYAPKRILVVYNTPEVQTKVEGFLKKVKKSLPVVKASCKSAEKSVPCRPAVLQAQLRTAQALETPPSEPTPPASPSRRAAGRPKHLFNFSIHYEGEGLIDDNVVNFCKAMNGDAAAKEKAANTYMSAPATEKPKEKKEKKSEKKDDSESEDLPEK